jgi:malic enzyme
VREVSFKVALEVAREAQRTGLAEVELDELEEIVSERMWKPHYVPLRRAAVNRYQFDVEGICSW